MMLPRPRCELSGAAQWRGYGPARCKRARSCRHRRTTAALASFIGRPLLEHTPYEDSCQDAAGQDDQDPKDDAKRASWYGNVTGYQINATHSSRFICVLISKVFSVDPEHSDNRQETNDGSKGYEDRNGTQPSVEEDASDKGKKEGNGESWPVAAVVEVANDEWRHGRTLIRALGGATH